MTLVLPTAEQSLTYPAQAVTDATDLGALGSAVQQTGVVSGCTVAALSTPGMAVSVAAGTVLCAGAAVSIAAVSSLTIATAPSTGDRRDIVVSSSAGVVSVVEGTANSATGWTATSTFLPPVKPAVPSGSVLLGEVYVAEGVTSIVSGAVVDKTTAVSVTSSQLFGPGGSSAVFSSNATLTGSGVVGCVYYQDLTIDAGVTVECPVHLFVAGTLSIASTGALVASGGNASGATGGSPLWGVNDGGPPNPGGAGGDGAAGNGANGGNPGQINPRQALVMGPAGPGGASTGTGGSGSGPLASWQPVAAQGSFSNYMMANGLNETAGVAASSQTPAGAGGGGGGGDGTNAGGGGGAGGGAMYICARNIVLDGTIASNGGNGAAGVAGDAAGGGGGAAGSIIINTAAISGTGTVSAVAGSGGAGVGTGAAGTAATQNTFSIQIFTWGANPSRLTDTGNGIVTL